MDSGVVMQRFIAALITELPRDLRPRQMATLMNNRDLLGRILLGLHLSDSGSVIWPDDIVWQSTVQTVCGFNRRARSKVKFNVWKNFDSFRGSVIYHSNTGECPPRKFKKAVETLVPDAVLEYGQLLRPIHDNEIRRRMEPFKPLKWQWVHSMLNDSSQLAGQVGPLLVQGSSNVFYLDDGMVVALTYIPSSERVASHWCMDFGSDERRPGDRVFRLKE